MVNRLRLIVFISGSGTNLQAIIDAISDGKLNAQIAAVVSNKESAKGLERAHKANIPCHVSSDESQWHELVLRYQPELIVLAGFMKILSEPFVNRYQGKIINIHPSLLPKYRGLHTHQRALAEKEKEHGSTIHFVNNTLDGGPIIYQSRIAILDDDNEQSLEQRIKQLEHLIYPRVLSWFADRRITLINECVLLDGKPIAEAENS